MLSPYASVMRTANTAALRICSNDRPIVLAEKEGPTTVPERPFFLAVVENQDYVPVLRADGYLAPLRSLPHMRSVPDSCEFTEQLSMSSGTSDLVGHQSIEDGSPQSIPMLSNSLHTPGRWPRLRLECRPSRCSHAIDFPCAS